MITIHHEKETDFSKNGYGAIDNYVMNQEVFWEMNGQFYAYLEYPAFLDKTDYLVNKNILRIPVPFMDDQLFRIYRTRKVLGFIQVEARHIFYDLMDNLIEDTNIVGKTGQGAVQQLLGATQYGHRFTGLSDITTTNNARMVRYNPVEALLDDTQANTFVSRWGGEVVRDNFIIRMAKQMGSDRGVHIQHKKDLLGYEATIDESTVVTRIMPIGFDGLKLPELYIDSPLIDLNNPKIRVIKYDDVKAATGMYAEDEDALPIAEAYALLRKYAKEEFSVNHLDEPETTVTVNFASLHNTKEYEEFSQLQEIQQGDVVKVSVPEEGFEITSRLVAFTSDPLQLNHYTSTTLGNHVIEFTSSSNDTTRMRNEVEQLKESVVTAMQAANGKNRNFWGSADPNTLSLNASVGDNYYRENGEETTLYQYVELNGERYWKEIIDTSKLSIVAGKVDEAMNEATQAKQDAINASNKALTDAKAYAVAQDTALKTSIQSEIGEVETGLSEVRQEADTKANKAYEDAVAEAERKDSELAQNLNDGLAVIEKSANEAKQDAIDLTNEAKQEAERLVSEVYKYYDTTLLTTIWYRGESPEMQRISGQTNLVGLLVETAQVSKEQANKAYLDAVAEAESKVQAKDAEYQSVFDDYDLVLNQATQDIQDSLSRADDALTEAGISTETAGTAKGLAEQAKQAADEAAAEVAEIPTKISNYIDSKGLVDGTFVDEKVDEATGAWSLELSRVESLMLPEVFTVLTAIWLRGENPQMNLSQIKNKIPQRGHVLYGAIWTKGPDPIMKRTTGDQALAESVSIFSAEYKRDVEGISHELMRIESNIPSLDGYATEFWANNRFETAQSVSQTLTAYTNTESLNDLLDDKANISDIPSLSGYAKESWVTNKNYQTASDVTQTLTNYAKVNDLTGMVTENTLATKNYVTAGSMSSTLTDYLKTTDLDGEVKETVAYQEVKETTDRFTRVIGSTDAQAKTNIAQIAMTDQIFQTSVNDILDNKGYITDTTLTMSATWVKGADPVMQRTSKLEELIRLANSAQSGVEDINRNIKLESIMGMTWFKRPSPRMQPINKLDALNSAVSVAQSKITQLSDMIDLRVTKEGLIGAINLQAGKTIFQQGDNKLVLTPETFYMPSATIESAQIKEVNASKVYGTSAEFDSVRAGVLVAEAVKSTHIEASTALVRKLFATSALIGELTSKTAFINNIKAVEIDASKITSGFISTARLNATTLRTHILTANVIESAHINASTALFDKLFSTNLATDRLVAQGAWITDANIVSLNASKINAGTIDTARLNASAIVTKGLTTDVVTATHIKSDTALIDNIFATQALVDRLWAKSIWTSKITTMSLNARQINAGTIDTARLNATSIVTAGLTTDVVKSTHIQSSTLLVDKIFATTALIERLTSKTAFIDSIKAINISADKINTGTLDAANVNIVNLNASSISAGTLTAIKLSGPSLNIDLSSGEVNFSKGSIKSANTEWNLSENYMNLEYTSNTGVSNRNRIVIGGPNDIKFYDNYNFSSEPDTLLGYMSMARLSSSPDVRMNITVRASDGSGGDYISLRSDGQLYISSLAHVTTSGTANMHSTSAGSIHRVTSALKYKADVHVAEDVIIDAKKILQLKPKSWLDKAELRDTGTSKRYYGFVADDFNQIGLTQVVSYFNGEVDSLNYDRLSIYHNVILSEHEQKIIELENRIEELESQLSA